MLAVRPGRRNHLHRYTTLNALSVPLLSIIIPAHNEEKRLPATLEQVFSFLQKQSYESEVLVIENGSADRTYEVAHEYARQHGTLRVIHEDGRGKGLAVRRGMLEARGKFRMMCDADLSMPIDEIVKFLPPQMDSYDIAIASREAKGAIRFNEPPYRHIGGRGINLLIRLLILPGLQDTQCGFKSFSDKVAEDIFRKQTLMGWSFDIELLFIARRHGYRVLEIPIHWYYQSDSKINALSDALKMISDIFHIHANARRGLYASK